MATIRVSCWNIQNLFDTVVSDIAADLEFTPEFGWDDAALDAKLTNLAQILRLMHGGQGPHLLGICEVENRPLLEVLIARAGLPNLRIAHVDNPDIRGIDTSLLYDGDVFEPDGEPVGHNIHLRFPTRDVFEVPLRVKSNGARLRVFVNHWPSRRSGVYESEPLRITVAEHCGRMLHGVLKFGRADYVALPDAPETLAALNRRFDGNVLLMGDFNDEPYSRSIVDYLLSGRDLDRIEEPLKKAGARELPLRLHTPTVRGYLQRDVFLFNCMWPTAGRSDHGSLYFGGGVNTMNLLDQFMVSRGLLFGLDGLRITLDSVRVLRDSPMATRGKRRPIAFDKQTKRGWSDHFPIEAEIEVL